MVHAVRWSNAVAFGNTVFGVVCVIECPSEYLPPRFKLTASSCPFPKGRMKSKFSPTPSSTVISGRDDAEYSF